MFDPNVANSLPNGAQILNRDQTDVWVWLAYWEGHAFPYVTWISNLDNPGATYWGHYFETLESAAKDFNTRLNEGTFAER